MRKNNIESRKIIEEYMKKNNIYSLENYSYDKFLNSYFLPMKYIIEGKEYLFGQEDAKIILDYMIKNDLPFFTRVFSELQLRYLKQEIDFNDENDKTKLK